MTKITLDIEEIGIEIAESLSAHTDIMPQTVLNFLPKIIAVTVAFGKAIELQSRLYPVFEHVGDDPDNKK